MREFTKDMNVIYALPDAPPLTASELKSKFDEGGLALKEYINEELLPAFETISAGIPAVINELTSDSVTDALSAAQGKALKSITDNLDTVKQKKITYGTLAPSGGADGDIYLQYRV